MAFEPGDVYTDKQKVMQRVIVLTADDHLVGLVVNSQGNATFHNGMKVADLEKLGWSYVGRAKDVFNLR